MVLCLICSIYEYVCGLNSKKSCFIILSFSGDISKPIQFSLGNCNKKLPFPALGSIIKSKLVNLYFSLTLFIHNSAIDGIV